MSISIQQKSAIVNIPHLNHAHLDGRFLSTLNFWHDGEWIMYLETEATMKQAGWRIHIQRKGRATKGISEAQRAVTVATPHARVEHVFDALVQVGGKLVCCIGIVRVTFALHLKAASYSLKLLVFLKEGGLAPV